jgi:hypothetical protein
MALRRADFDDLPAPLRLIAGGIYGLGRLEEAIVYALLLGVALACLVVGTTLARVIGAVLIIICLAIGFRVVRRHLASRS